MPHTSHYTSQLQLQFREGWSESDLPFEQLSVEAGQKNHVNKTILQKKNGFNNRIFWGENSCYLHIYANLDLFGFSSLIQFRVFFLWLKILSGYFKAGSGHCSKKLFPGSRKETVPLRSFFHSSTVGSRPLRAAVAWNISSPNEIHWGLHLINKTSQQATVAVSRQPPPYLLLTPHPHCKMFS